ncbi:MAG: nucleotidyltransferase domain-containing protein [Dehalococcoidia bacterium]
MDRAVYRVIKDYRKILEGMGVRVKRIILYGSHTLGLSREDSDIDLVVISDDFGKMDLWERLTLLGQAAAILKKPIEALGYTEGEFVSKGEGSFIVDEVKSKGVEVK